MFWNVCKDLQIMFQPFFLWCFSCYFSRRQKTWCRYASWISFAGRVGSKCLFPWWESDVHLWGSRLPSKSSSSSAVSKCNLTPMMKEFNTTMSSVRASVECLFGDVINSFRFVDLRKNLKIRMNSVGKMYIVCALLRNSPTCLYVNRTSNFLRSTHLL